MEYDHKKDQLTYFTKNLRKGKHILKVKVKDKLNNEKQFIKDFTYLITTFELITYCLQNP